MNFPKYGDMLKKPSLLLLTDQQREIALASKIYLNLLLWI